MIFFTFIPGLMFGAEWQYDDGFIVFDLGIIRILIDYRFSLNQPPEQSQ